MSGTLTFMIDDTLKAIIAHARTSATRSPNFADLFDPEILKDGIVPKGEYATIEEIDQSKIAPSVWLVKDQGVYLMSPGQPPLPSADGKGNLVAYAVEANPMNEGWYDAGREIMGGDDGCDKLDLDLFEMAIAAGARSIQVKVTPESLEMSI